MDRTDVLELSTEVAALAEQVAGGDSESSLQRLVELAVKSVGACRYAGISGLRGKQAVLLAASDPVVSQLATLQNDLGDGPGLAAMRHEENIVVQDLLAESRWPRFGTEAVRAGVCNLIAYRLPGHRPSVLMMYGSEANGFSAEALDDATLFATQAATLVALLSAREHAANLEIALQSSREIGMALGILMAHHKVTGDGAFDLLRGASQNLHRKLREVAVEVMETGVLPELPSRPDAD